MFLFRATSGQVCTSPRWRKAVKRVGISFMRHLWGVKFKTSRMTGRLTTAGKQIAKRHKQLLKLYHSVVFWVTFQTKGPGQNEHILPIFKLRKLNFNHIIHVFLHDVLLMWREIVSICIRFRSASDFFSWPRALSIRPNSGVGMVKWNAPFRSDRSHRKKWFTSRGGAIFSKLLRLDRTVPFSLDRNFLKF